MSLITRYQTILSLRWARRYGYKALTGFTVILCLLLMLICAYLFYGVVLPRSTGSSFYFKLLLIIYLHVQFITSYYSVLITEPGVPDVPESIEEKNGQRLPTCDKCGCARPNRTHHCSICQRCILKYDHHCFWTNGCIGLLNHGYFLKFLLFGFLAASFTLIQFVGVILREFFTSFLKSRLFFVCLSLWVLLGSAGSCLMMLLLQLKIILHNETSVEFERNANKKRELRRKGLKYIYPYSTNLKEHLKELFGPHWLKSILLPLKFTPSCTGYDYEMNPLSMEPGLEARA
ncbi:Palmitoyltransferase [Giardia muris]|uniref:Palmitoyltransferase n=1 Tax=Giardia muris TaxID=5742 RepID=A0A4Z1T7Q2_GIAMU|nr:Palmitoyltransferase [Giardia muris]|eukprot:TNJ28521.1 Palmitoyltransferase [Giardia muris]